MSLIRSTLGIGEIGNSQFEPSSGLGFDRINSRKDIQETSSRLYSEFLQATIEIKTEHHSGSGFFIDRQGHAATAAHVIYGSREIFAITSDGKKHKAQLEKLDDLNDLAELKIMDLDTTQQKYVEPGSSNSLTEQSHLFTIGHPLGVRPATIKTGDYLSSTQAFSLVDKEGTADQYNSLSDADKADLIAALSRKLTVSDIELKPGNSGGMVLDQSGKLVGIAEATGVDGKSYLSPVEDLSNLIHEKTNKFAFTYGLEGTPLNQGFLSDYPSAIGVAGGLVAARTFFGAGSKSLTSGSLAEVAAATGVIYGTEHLYKDLKSFWESTSSKDNWKYGLASALDASIVASSAISFFPQARATALVATGAEVAARVATDFIPSRLVLKDINRTDGDSRAPFSWESVRFRTE